MQRFVYVISILLMDTCKSEFWGFSDRVFLLFPCKRPLYLFLVPVTMVLARESTVSCASWREIPFNKFKFNLSNEQLRYYKFGNGKATAFGPGRRISSAYMCKSLRSQSRHSAKYCLTSNINRRTIQGKIIKEMIR